MAKRYSDSGKWDRAWFRKLPPRLKCAWDYLCSKCDVVGIWNMDMEKMTFDVGEAVTVEDLQKHFKIQVFDEDKIFIPGFVPFQYGDESGRLSPKNSFHRSISEKLQARGFPAPEFKSLETTDPTPPLDPGVTPPGGGTPQGRGRGRGRGRGNEEGGAGETTPPPEGSRSESSEETPPPAPPVPITRADILEVVEAWKQCLDHRGQDPTLVPGEDKRLGDFMVFRGKEGALLAILGMKYEPSNDKYKASQHVHIGRLIDPKKFDYLVGLGRQAKTLARAEPAALGTLADLTGGQSRAS